MNWMDQKQLCNLSTDKKFGVRPFYEVLNVMQNMLAVDTCPPCILVHFGII